MSALDELRRLTGPLAGAMKAMLGRAVINLVQEATKVRTLQLDLQADEVADDVEQFQEYGFTSRPFPDCEAIVICPGGTRSHMVVIATEDRRYRLTTLEEGEVAIYDDQGQVVHLKRGGIVVQTDKPVTVNAEKLLVTASAEISIEAGGTLSIESAGDATIKAPNILLDGNVDLGGAGGPAVARVGDPLSTGGTIVGTGAAKAKAP